MNTEKDENIITLAGETYKIEESVLPQQTLKFYVDNPRVYSYFDRSEREPTQIEIENVMCGLDSVRELRNAIESTGGLVEPIKVLAGENIVLEGNRRLAAYRLLSKKDPVKWQNIKCIIYPKEMSDTAIFALLGQYHLNGQEPWKPFETAGYLYRRIKSTHSTPDAIAKELSMTKSKITKFYNTYKFMVDHDDLQSDHWSYYLEYLGSRKISEKRIVFPELDETFTSAVKNEKLVNAQKDVRDKLEVIAKQPDSIANSRIKQFISGVDLDECCKDLSGKNIKKDIESFKNTISQPDVAKTIQKLSRIERDEYEFLLKFIDGEIQKILEMMNKQ